MCAHTPPFQPGMEAKEGTPLWSLLKLLWMQKKMLCIPQEPICYCLSKLVFMPAGCIHQSTSSSQAQAMLNFQWCAQCAICSRCYGYLVCNWWWLIVMLTVMFQGGTGSCLLICQLFRKNLFQTKVLQKNTSCASAPNVPTHSLLSSFSWELWALSCWYLAAGLQLNGWKMCCSALFFAQQALLCLQAMAAWAHIMDLVLIRCFVCSSVGTHWKSKACSTWHCSTLATVHLRSVDIDNVQHLPKHSLLTMCTAQAALVAADQTSWCVGKKTSQHLWTGTQQRLVGCEIWV